MFMRFLYVFLLGVVLNLLAAPIQAMPVLHTGDRIIQPVPHLPKNKVKKVKEFKKYKKIKKVQSNQAVGMLIFIIGCIVLLLGLGIVIVAITDAVLGIGIGIVALGFVLMSVGDIIGNLGLMNLILDLCNCVSVLV